MEGLRDAALADYENLPDQEKAKIHNDFNQMLATGGVSLFIEFSQEFYPQIVDFLQLCEGHEEERLDFNDYIAVKYVVEKHDRVICNGCWSLVLRRPYFSCYECFFHDSYDLCSGCYRSKKFKDHYHKEFYDNDKLLRLCRKMVVENKEDLETRNNRTNRAAIEFASKFLDFARSITTDGLENHLDRVLNFDKNEELGRDSKEPEEKEEKEENSALPRPKLDPQKVRRLTDLLGVKPSVQTHPSTSRYD